MQRVACPDAFIPILQKLFQKLNLSEATAISKSVGLPFAPILRPDQLFDDPHINHHGVTLEVTLRGALTDKLDVPLVDP